MNLTPTSRDILRQRLDEVTAIVESHRGEQARHEDRVQFHRTQVAAGEETIAELQADLAADARARGAHTPA